MTALSPRRTFSGTALKTIACITMLVDHIGASCIEAGILTPCLLYTSPSPRDCS